jgi:hypothetical protein
MAGFLRDIGFIRIAEVPLRQHGLRHSGAAPTGPRKARPDDRLHVEPGIQGFPDVQLQI